MTGIQIDAVKLVMMRRFYQIYIGVIDRMNMNEEHRWGETVWNH